MRRKNKIQKYLLLFLVTVPLHLCHSRALAASFKLHLNHQDNSQDSGTWNCFCWMHSAPKLTLNSLLLLSLGFQIQNSICLGFHETHFSLNFHHLYVNLLEISHWHLWKRNRKYLKLLFRQRAAIQVSSRVTKNLASVVNRNLLDLLSQMALRDGYPVKPYYWYLLISWDRFRLSNIFFNMNIPPFVSLFLSYHLEYEPKWNKTRDLTLFKLQAIIKIIIDISWCGWIFIYFVLLQDIVYHKQ